MLHTYQEGWKGACSLTFCTPGAVCSSEVAGSAGEWITGLDPAAPTPAWLPQSLDPIGVEGGREWGKMGGWVRPNNLHTHTPVWPPPSPAPLMSEAVGSV